MRQLPEGMLTTPTSSVVRPGHGQQHQSNTADGRRGQLGVGGHESNDDTVHEKIADKWNELKMFCCRRRVIVCDRK